MRAYCAVTFFVDQFNFVNSCLIDINGQAVYLGSWSSSPMNGQFMCPAIENVCLRISLVGSISHTVRVRHGEH